MEGVRGEYMEKLFVSVPEAAETLSMSPTRVWGLIAKGEIPSILLGGRSRRIRVDALKKWADEQTAAGAAAEAGGKHV
jgi:excisionase family DNA binding protein